MKNGPVVAQMQPYTDFLAYAEGTYHRTQDAFKFNGYHVVKIVGWTHTIDYGTEWIVENTWGSDWGEDGYARISSRSDTHLDLYAIGLQVFPFTMAEQYQQYYQQQAQQEADGGTWTQEELEAMMGGDDTVDLDDLTGAYDDQEGGEELYTEDDL